MKILIIKVQELFFCNKIQGKWVRNMKAVTLIKNGCGTYIYKAVIF